MFAHFDSVGVIQPNNAGKCQDAATLDLAAARAAVILAFVLFEFKSQCRGDLKPERRKVFLVSRHRSWHRRRGKDALLSLVCSCSVWPWLGVNKCPISHNKNRRFTPNKIFFCHESREINAHIL